MNPVEASPWFEKLVMSAIEVPGPEIQQIAQVARQREINVVIGVNERNPNSFATIYNTLVTINHEGSALLVVIANWCLLGLKS